MPISWHEEFLYLLSAFDTLYQVQSAQRTTEGKPRKRKPGGGVKGNLAPTENKLLFILAYTKAYELQTFLGLHFGLSQPQANYWIQRLRPLLQQALAQCKQIPERDPAKVAAYVGPDAALPHLIIDGTERRRQRPKDPIAQKENDSGKKKPTPTRT